MYFKVWIQIYKENYVISYQITTYDISHILQMTKKHSFLKNILIMGKDRLVTYVMQMVVTFLFMIFQLFFQRKIKFCSIYIWQICYLKNYDSKYPTTVIFFMNSNKGCKEMQNALISKKKELTTSKKGKKKSFKEMNENCLIDILKKLSYNGFKPDFAQNVCNK